MMNPLNVNDYLDLVIHQHRDKPKFRATLKAPMKMIVDFVNYLIRCVNAIDLDSATFENGALDIIGEWVGRNKDSFSGTITPDLFRLILRSKIISNTWDGSLEKMYETWDSVFPDRKIWIGEYGLLEIVIALLLKKCTPEEITLIREAGIIPKPSGVKIVTIYVPPEDGKLTACDLQNECFAGVDESYIAEEVTPR